MEKISYKEFIATDVEIKINLTNGKRKVHTTIPFKLNNEKYIKLIHFINEMTFLD